MQSYINTRCIYINNNLTENLYNLYNYANQLFNGTFPLCL